MFAWLRDALNSGSSASENFRHSMTPPSSSRQAQQDQQHQHDVIVSSSDDTDISDGDSFYNNPYHSSGRMNYADVPQQQYSNEHTYPTYLARQQLNDTSSSPLDDQIHAKLLALQQRGNPLAVPCYAHRRNSYAYRNRTLSSPVASSFVPNSPAKHSDPSEEEEEEGEEDIDDDERSSIAGNYHGVPGYYSGQYSNMDEQFDFASVVFWYRNVMRSVKKLL
jgi:hypothetical protein